MCVTRFVLLFILQLMCIECEHSNSGSSGAVPIEMAKNYVCVSQPDSLRPHEL